MAKFLECPLRFRVETIQKAVPDQPTGAKTAGTAIHAALEMFMALPMDERSPDALPQFVEAVLEAVREDPEYVWLAENNPDQLKGFDAKVRRVAPRVFDMMEPSQMPIAGLELKMEVEFEGRILRGIIDVLGGADDDLTVIDWKSGRAPGERYQAKAMLGIDFYSVMVNREYGVMPNEVVLAYLDPRITIAKEPTERSVSAMERKISAVFDAIDRACESDSFQPSPSKLCDWCPVKPHCPAHGGDLAVLSETSVSF